MEDRKASTLLQGTRIQGEDCCLKFRTFEESATYLIRQKSQNIPLIKASCFYLNPFKLHNSMLKCFWVGWKTESTDHASYEQPLLSPAIFPVRDSITYTKTRCSWAPVSFQSRQESPRPLAPHRHRMIRRRGRRRSKRSLLSSKVRFQFVQRHSLHFRCLIPFVLH